MQDINLKKKKNNKRQFFPILISHIKLQTSYNINLQISEKKKSCDKNILAIVAFFPQNSGILSHNSACFYHGIINKKVIVTFNLMHNSYLFFFAIANLCLTLWRFRPWLLGDAVCKLSMFVGECCTFSSILHMTALGAERYLAVCFPLRARLLVTRGRVRALIAGLWGVAMLSAGPVFALVGVEQFEGGASECRCTQYAHTSGLLKAMLWLSNLYFICPLTILSLLYGLIARRLHLRAHTHRDKTHRQTLLVIVLVFILCWLPFHVSRTLFSVSDSSDQLYYISQYFNLVSLVLFYVSAAVNPLLYNIMSARYRANVLAMLNIVFFHSFSFFDSNEMFQI
uniref:Growth hormone secretagogue receptor type 1-like n=1 Tax=Cyprinus carpio TaxID=7962 RepID=A0A8C1WBK8_CYPCA